MVIEVVGQQLRIRVSPKKKSKGYVTLDVGDVGKLQKVSYKEGKKYVPQSWRLNLGDYSRFQSIINELNGLYCKGVISRKDLSRAKLLARKWWREKK